MRLFWEAESVMALQQWMQRKILSNACLCAALASCCRQVHWSSKYMFRHHADFCQSFKSIGVSWAIMGSTVLHRSAFCIDWGLRSSARIQNALQHEALLHRSKRGKARGPTYLGTEGSTRASPS